MQRLMLRQLSRIAYSTTSQLPKSKALTTITNAEGITSLSQTSNEAIKAHQQYLLIKADTFPKYTKILT